jgi:hypothetical protein
VFYCSGNYYGLWVLSLWIALFCIIDYEWFHCELHCLVGNGEIAYSHPWVNSSLGEAAAPGLQTPGARANKPWAPARHVVLQAPGCRRIALRLPWMLALALGPASGLLGPSSGPTPHGSYVRTHFAWVLHNKDPMILGPDSGPISLGSYLGSKSLGSFVRIQFSLVLLFVL